MAIHFDLDDNQFIALLNKMDQDIADGLFVKPGKMVVANTKDWLQLYGAELSFPTIPGSTKSKSNWRLTFANEGAGLIFKLKWL